MDKLLRSVPGRINLTVTDSGGTLLDLDSPPVVTIDDSGGNSIAVGTATRASQGLYSLAVTPTFLDVFTAAWSGTVSGNTVLFTTEYEVVGGFYFSVAEARAWKFQSGDLSSVTKFPTAAIVEARNRIEERWEAECCVAFVPRGVRAVYDGTGRADLDLQDLPGTDIPRWAEGPVRPRKVVSVTMDGNAFSIDDLADLALYPSGTIVRKSNTWNSGFRNVTILFERGYAQPPADVKKAALRLLQRELVPGSLEDTVIAVTNEMGTRSLSTASGPQRRPFGIPEIDAIYWTHNEQVPGLA